MALDRYNQEHMKLHVLLVQCMQYTYMQPINLSFICTSTESSRGGVCSADQLLKAGTDKCIHSVEVSNLLIYTLASQLHFIPQQLLHASVFALANNY